MKYNLERGTVKFYHAARLYGFIDPDNGQEHVFVHARSISMSGLDTLASGDRVEYQRVRDNRGYQAYRLKLV